MKSDTRLIVRTSRNFGRRKKKYTIEEKTDSECSALKTKWVNFYGTYYRSNQSDHLEIMSSSPKFEKY